MSSRQTIVIDAMGGDLGPRLCVPAALNFKRKFPDTDLILVGQAQLISPLLDDNAKHGIEIVDVEQVVDMAESPASAYRHKRESSMWKSLELLAESRAQGCVSAGNTGALMAMSRHIISTVNGVDRPAICKPMPTANGVSYMLDLGANLDCPPNQLLQFALLGSALARTENGSDPTVALLNVGVESNKGNKDIQQAHALLEEHPNIRFKGFIEGNELYNGDVDVVVCDGFVGNVALKVSEGVASFITSSLRKEFSSNPLFSLIGLINSVVLRSWRARFNPSKYNGAALLGLQKVVVKSHGGADPEGFFYALCQARQQIVGDIPGKIAVDMSSL